MTNHEKRKVLEDAFMFRHACKKFDTTKKISEEDFDFILEAGRLSPSSLGFEPWKFVVVQNEGVRKTLAEASKGAKTQIPTASHVVILLARIDARYDSEYVKHIYKDIKKVPDEVWQNLPGNYKNFQVDILGIDNDRLLQEWVSRSAYIALGNMLTAAAAIGIDSCAMEGIDYDVTGDTLESLGQLNKKEYAPIAAMGFGYRAEEPHFPKTRRDKSEVIGWIN